MTSRPIRTATARISVCLLLAAAALTAGLELLPMSVVGAGATPTALAAATSADAPAWTYIDIGAEYAQPTPFCLVGGELPTGTPLPQPVELAVPASSTPQWVGEVYASNSVLDTQLPYKVSRRGTMDVYSFTLKGSRLGQVEALVPGLITVSESNYQVSLSWVAPGPVDTCRIAVTMPPNAEVVKAADGAQTVIDTGGNKHYYRLVNKVKAGDTVSLNFTYAIPTATEIGTSGGIPLIWWVLGIVAVVAVVLLVVVLRQSTRSTGGPSGGEPGSTE